MTDIDADPRDETRRLIDCAEGRAPLDTLRAVFSDRLHRRSNDFDATRGLRLVTAKLQHTSYGPPVVTTSS